MAKEHSFPYNNYCTGRTHPVKGKDDFMENKFDDLQVILICGNYNSGKSHLAHTRFKSRKRINRTEIRHFLKEMFSHGEPWTQEDYSEKNEPMVKHIESTILKSLLEQNEKIIIDNTSVTEKSRARYIRETKAAGASIGCIYIQTPVATLLERNRKREQAVRPPENIISQLHATTQLPAKKEGFKTVSIIQG